MPAVSKRRKLTKPERDFAEHYLVHGSALEAQRHAYPSSKATDTTRSRRAHEILNRSRVAAYLAGMRKKSTSKAVMTRQRALELLTEIGEGRVPTYLTPDGEIDEAKVAAGGADVEEFTKAVTHTDRSTTTRTKVKVRNPVQAIERLAKMQGWDKPDQLQVEGVTFNLQMGDDE
jgi:phage terminase small subunit